jgi:hypothetical protein
MSCIEHSDDPPVFPGSSLPADAMRDGWGRDIAGLWQSLSAPNRYLEIVHKKSGGYQGQIFFPDDVGGNENGNSISTITISKKAISFIFDKRKGTFQGVISEGSKSIC